MEELDGSSQRLFSDRDAKTLVRVQGARQQSTMQIPPGGWGGMVCGCVEIAFTRNVSLTAKEVRQAVYWGEAEVRGK